MKSLVYKVFINEVISEEGTAVKSYGLQCISSGKTIGCINDISTEYIVACKLADFYTYGQFGVRKAESITQYLLSTDCRFWHYLGSE